MDEVLNNKLIEFRRGAERLSLISAHDALTLLKVSGSASKLSYILRASPCVGHSLLSDIDSLLRSTLSSICNACKD